jgi:lincosamide nucleotidyltransferase A/C/D/E
MCETQSRELPCGLSEIGIGYWVVGGWGVDALLGEQTRAHHDLDLLVDARDLPALHAWLRAKGFARGFEWTENSSVTIDGRMWDTAFVERHADGRELDVHAVHIADGLVRLATTDPWEFPPNILSGTGRIGGYEVPCASVSGQRAMNVGYDLPEKHREDLRRLERPWATATPSHAAVRGHADERAPGAT